MRPLLIAGYYGFGNLGDEAILEVLLAGLSRRIPDARPVVLSGDPAATRRAHGVEAIDRQDLPAVAELVGEAGLFVLGGGGLFQDYWPVPLAAALERGIGGLPFYFRFPVLATATGCPLAVLAVGVGPLASDEGRRMACATFELASAASVRDRLSLELLRSLAPVGREPELTADPATLLEPAPAETLAGLLQEMDLASEEPIFGVSVRHWAFGTDPERWEREVALAIDAHLGSRSDSVLFVPFQSGGIRPGEDDLAVCERIAARLAAPSRARVIRRHLTPRLALALLANCRQVLAMRYHAALFALVSGVPTVALAYDPKLSGLFREAQLEDLALPSSDWTACAISDALARAATPSRRTCITSATAAWRRRAEAGLDQAARAWLVRPPLRDAPRALAEIALAAALAAWNATGPSPPPRP